MNTHRSQADLQRLGRDFMVGQEYELNYPYEGVDHWRRVRIVSVSDDGKAVWVKMVVNPCNSFPVRSADLRPLPSLSAGESGR